MNKLFLLLLACGVSALLASVLTGPKPTAPSPLFSGTRVDPQVLAIIERSCQNCHSSNTEWPLYARVFPVSLLIENDVRAAKSHMDLSRWQSYSDDEKRRMLAEIGYVVRGRIMPPRRYTLVHPSAKLTAREIDAIYRWTRAARRTAGTR